MTKKIERLQRPLTCNEIEFRVQQVKKTNNGVFAILLAYKDARCDMRRLDSVFGVDGWQRDYKQIGSLMLCGVSIWHEKSKQWVTKWDTGTESNTEAAKGLASDSFKRACFNLGIGRELYDYPSIFIWLENGEFTEKGNKVYASFSFLKDWRWINEFDDGKLVYLAGKDANGKTRFSFGEVSETNRRVRQIFARVMKHYQAELSEQETSTLALMADEANAIASDSLMIELLDFKSDVTGQKNYWNAMHAKGAEIYRKAIDNYREHKANDDEFGMQEVIEELPEFYQKRLLEVVK